MIMTAKAVQAFAAPPKRIHAYTADDLQRYFTNREEVFVHGWDSYARTVVVPVNAAGKHDGNEWLGEQSRLRVQSFAGNALIGMTHRPYMGTFARWFNRMGANNGHDLHVAADVFWFDLLDRKTGQLADYDTAFHYIARKANLPWLAQAMRTSFGHVPGVSGTGNIHDWIASLFEGHGAMELLLKPMSGTSAPDGSLRRYLLCREDWK